MIELNNCTTCGRKPEIGFSELSTKNMMAICRCGKQISSAGLKIWSAEVAADMWNRANPQEDGFEFRRDYINYLAAELASYRLNVTASENGLTIKETRPSDAQTAKHINALIEECEYHKQDLTEFYKKRLKPGVNV